MLTEYEPYVNYNKSRQWCGYFDICNVDQLKNIMNLMLNTY